MAGGNAPPASRTVSATACPATRSRPAGDEIYATFEGLGFPDPDAPATAVVFDGLRFLRVR